MVGNVSFENNITSLGVYGFRMNSAINTFLQQDSNPTRIRISMGQYNVGTPLVFPLYLSVLFRVC